MSRANLGTFPTIGPVYGAIPVPAGSSSVAVDPGESGGVDVTSFSGICRGELLAVKNAGGGSVTIHAGAAINLKGGTTLVLPDPAAVALFVGTADGFVSLV